MSSAFGATTFRSSTSCRAAKSGSPYLPWRPAYPNCLAGPTGSSIRRGAAALCWICASTTSTSSIGSLASRSRSMPEGYPFTAALKVLCEGGVVEFMFRAGGVSVEMGGTNSLVVYEPGKSYALDAKPGDAYENQASYFVDCVRNGHTPNAGTAAQARLAVLCAEAARRSLESGAVVGL